MKKWDTEEKIKHTEELKKDFGRRVSIDEVHVKAGRWKYLVVARDDISGWPEKIGLVNLTERSISECFTSEWICRYGTSKEDTVDGEPEFGKELQDAVKKLGSKIRVTTPYYPESQGMVERGYKQLKDALVKMCGENGSKLKEYLPLVKLADRISTKRATGYSPFKHQFGQKAVLPIDIESKKYLAGEWHKAQTVEDLL
ncbi:hypothetical protein O181_065297 [Austropuccinia psidii MF-1]|uniref:Integrase catalytic domain-containing protein n=1 Tax=Austropuccinia psidii MF-1 TaxID=1389203 RepID=A0A9Q3I360_9BASI|nr:hypothetical protein [Austropuccinia psidii MF-1]